MTSRIRSLPLGMNRHLLSGSAAVATIGVFVGLLALVLWSWSDGAVPAHGLDHIDDNPDKMRSQELDRPLGLTPAAVPPVAENQGFAVPVDTPVGGGQPAVGMQATPPHPFDTVTSSSTTASAVVELNLTIKSMPVDAVSGSSIELYLEDDFQVPDSIDPNAVYFTVANPFTANTNNGRPVHAAGSIEIKEDDYYGGDDDWSVRVFIPDMSDAADGFDGPQMGQTVSLVFTRDAGIRNPSEEGIHSVGYSVLGPTDRPNDYPLVNLGTLHTYAKIALSDVDNTSGYELTVTGYGFNNGTSAAVYVLDREPAQGQECEDIIRNGVRVGVATVGSDDRVAVTFEVAVPPFRPGGQNYICMIDGEGRMARHAKRFHLQSYISVEPATANIGDTVHVFAHDYPNIGAPLTELRIAGQVVWPRAAAGGDYIEVNHSVIDTNGSASLSFKMPGSLSGADLIGMLRIDAKWGDVRSSSKVGVTNHVPPVTNITACSGPSAGEVMLSWDAVSAASHYRIGYVNMVQDYPRAKATVTGEWIEAFIYVDVNARNLTVSDDGRVQYILPRLVNGDRHAFTVLTSKNVVNTVEMLSGEYIWPRNPRWQFLTVAYPEPDCR